jgi:regulatory protein
MSAFAAGLRMLARRELTEAQIRTRLARRRFPEEEIEEAVAKLQRSGALDDRRAALACARTEAHVRRHGRLRVLRQLEASGVSRTLARAAVDEVFADVDEDALIHQALDRRLRHGLSLHDPAVQRRLQRHLIAQGFDVSRVNAALRTRIRNFTFDD